MAFTEIAATLLPNGITVHKALYVLVPLMSDSLSNVVKLARLPYMLTISFIIEIPLQHLFFFIFCKCRNINDSLY